MLPILLSCFQCIFTLSVDLTANTNIATCLTVKSLTQFLANHQPKQKRTKERISLLQGIITMYTITLGFLTLLQQSWKHTLYKMSVCCSIKTSFHWN